MKNRYRSFLFAGLMFGALATPQYAIDGDTGAGSGGPGTVPPGEPPPVEVVATPPEENESYDYIGMVWIAGTWVLL